MTTTEIQVGDIVVWGNTRYEVVRLACGVYRQPQNLSLCIHHPHGIEVYELDKNGGRRWSSTQCVPGHKVRLERR